MVRRRVSLVTCKACNLSLMGAEQYVGSFSPVVGRVLVVGDLRRVITSRSVCDVSSNAGVR